MLLYKLSDHFLIICRIQIPKLEAIKSKTVSFLVKFILAICKTKYRRWWETGKDLTVIAPSINNFKQFYFLSGN